MKKVLLIVAIALLVYTIVHKQKPVPIGQVVTEAPKGTCFVGGCSGEVCSDQKDVASNCIYKESFACYKSATCERQASGTCGWTDTPGLASCLKKADMQPATSMGMVVGTVTIGPFCPVERPDTPCPVPRDAYSSREVIVYRSDSTTEQTHAKLDAKGRYSIALPAGKYFIQIRPAGIGPGEKKPVTITGAKTAVLDFDIDTGIR